jgi:alkylhydroperoxidase family enzyme
MGHSQMLLAVAGLKDDEIKQRTEKLASGDWSDFLPAERLAFQFAYKLTRDPSAVSDKDVKGLIGTFGRNRAVDLIWYGSWCNYMTRVADAFQLPLERDNVFAEPRDKQPKDGDKGSRDK